MSASNQAVQSREYKLMLNTDRFKDRLQGAEDFLDLLELLIKKATGTITERQTKEERRYTSYLDTPELALHRRGFALRLREEAEGEFQLNLKYRAADRYLAAAQNLSSQQPDGHKFEEDILPPFVSKFSRSATVKTAALPSLHNLNDVLAVFPGLQNLQLDGAATVQTVNDFRVLEVTRKLCKFQFGKSLTLKASLSFWYLSADKEDWPLVGEFSFDYDAVSSANHGGVENYPAQTVVGANRFFKAVQNQPGWLDVNGTTKTAFALEG